MLTRKGPAKGPARCWDMHPLTLLLCAAFLPTVWLMDLKALDEFVNLPDPHYNYTFLKKTFWPYTWIVVVNIDTISMTSQKWLDESEVDNPVWTHELIIFTPTSRKYKQKCLLLILPDQNDKIHENESYMKKNLTKVAGDTKSIVAVLRRTLPQPLTFPDHPLGRENIEGNDIVAYTWQKFMNNMTASAPVLVQFPMVKAVVRAMDTIQAYVEKNYNKDITDFALTGVGLGGWISWLTAAVDKRVEAIIPVAMDFLNFTESFKHHYRAYCGWSYMMRPFYEMNITQELDNPRFQELASHLDPLEYNERYENVIKYIIRLSGDEFFPPDMAQYYYPQLEGKKFLLIMPNTDYGNLQKNGLMDRISTFWFFIAKERKLPRVSWEMKMTDTSGIITMATSANYRVEAYYADTRDDARRDFRMKKAAGNSFQNNPVKWIKTYVDNKKEVYSREISIPSTGWRGFFMLVVFTEETPGNFMATSEMLVMADTYPCPDCYGDECRGTLV